MKEKTLPHQVVGFKKSMRSEKKTGRDGGREEKAEQNENGESLRKCCMKKGNRERKMNKRGQQWGEKLRVTHPEECVCC